MLFCYSDTKSNQIADMAMIKRSQALIFAYDLHDVDSLKLVFKMYSQAKPLIKSEQIPHFLLGITKDNVNSLTINGVKELKVYQQAEKMAQEEPDCMFKDSHHVIDSRAVAFLKQMLENK